MMTHKNTADKSKGFTLSEQVRKILNDRGFSTAFNYDDYRYFKQKCIEAYNIAYAIADMFIDDAPQANDFNDYIF